MQDNQNLILTIFDLQGPINTII